MGRFASPAHASWFWYRVGSPSMMCTVAPTRVAELWPFAIVMSDDLYAFDAAEFDALARDVRARLITVSAAPPDQADLGKKILEAFRRRMA